MLLFVVEEVKKKGETKKKNKSIGQSGKKKKKERKRTNERSFLQDKTPRISFSSSRTETNKNDNR